MKFNRLVFAAATGLFLCCGSAAQLPFKNGERIAFLGDSITQLGTDDPRGWVNIVEREVRAGTPEVSFIQAGISGNNSEQMAKRFDRDVLSRKPNWMFFSCGVNDAPNGLKGDSCNPGRPVDAYCKSLNEIFDKCDKKGVRVIVLSQTPVIEAPVDHAANRNLVAYNAALKRIAGERKYVYLDPGGAIRAEIAKKSDKTVRTLTVDGTHLNDRGNAIFAEAVLSGLR